jgi:hypothetical protein
MSFSHTILDKRFKGYGEFYCVISLSTSTPFKENYRKYYEMTKWCCDTWNIGSEIKMYFFLPQHYKDDIRWAYEIGEKSIYNKIYLKSDAELVAFSLRWS